MVKIIASLAEFQKEIQGPGLVVVDFYAGNISIYDWNLNLKLKSFT